MKTFSSLLVILGVFWPAAVRAQTWMDRSHTIFLPEKIQERLSVQMDFPSFWWNFVLIEPESGAPAFAKAEDFCRQIQDVPPTLVKKSACPQLSSILPLLESWSLDLFRRRRAPLIGEIENRLADAQTKATMSFGSDLLKVLRTDPLESYRDLQNILVKNVSFGFEKQNGFFVDPATKRIVIPVQFAFSPQETASAKSIQEKTADLNGGKPWTWIGPHIAALENESNVLKDMDFISWLGTFFLILQLAFVFLTRRWSYLWLIPPMLAGVCGAGVLTVLIYGSIHGLTLSLGTGIIALALDYGLHSIHNIRWRGVWKANLFGLLTTYAGLLAISLSAIPLLRQMMVFAILGLTLSYVFYYFFHRRFPMLVEVRPFRYLPKIRRWKTAVALFFTAAGLVGGSVLRPELDMRQFDAQNPESRQKLIWLFAHIQQRSPLFSVRPLAHDSLDTAFDEQDWAFARSIKIHNLHDYLPRPDFQRANIESWSEFCPRLETLARETKILFEPFLNAWPCTPQNLRELSPPPLYLSDIVSKNRALTTWFPENDDQTAAIKNYDTEAFALGDVIQQFPHVLARELAWMVPVSLAICIVLLWLYYRRWLWSLISLVPFLTGVGTYFFSVAIFGWGYSFISIIGLIMVFGLSIDYGIFAANLYLLEDPPPSDGVWSCLFLASTVTILGFLPLALVSHPVLVHLGQTLVLGSLGTWIGTVWGIPGLFQLLQKETR